VIVRTPPALRRCHGYSVVEVMIAIAVLSVGLLGLVSVVVSSGTLTRESVDTVIATEDLNSAVELVKGTPYNNLFGNPNLFLGASGTSMGTEMTAFHGLHLLDEKITVTFKTFTGSPPAVVQEQAFFPMGGFTVPSPLPPTIEILLTISWSAAAGPNQRLNGGQNTTANATTKLLTTVSVVRAQAG